MLNNIQIQKLKNSLMQVVYTKEAIIASRDKQISLLQEDNEFYKQRNVCLQNQAKRRESDSMAKDHEISDLKLQLTKLKSENGDYAVKVAEIQSKCEIAEA